MKSIKRSFVEVALVSAAALALVIGAVSVYFLVAKTDADATVAMNLACSNLAAGIDLMLDSAEDSTRIEVSLMEEDFKQQPSQSVNAHLAYARQTFGIVASNTECAVSYFAQLYLDGGYVSFYSARERDNVPFHKVSSLAESLGCDDLEAIGWDEQALRRGEPLWLEPSLDDDADIRVISYVMPIIVDGVYKGTVGMGIDFEKVVAIASETIAYKSGYAYLTDAEGNVMYHPTIPSGTNLTHDEDIPAVGEAISAGTTTNSIVLYQYRGANKRMAFHLLKNEMRLVLCVEASELYGTRNQLVIVDIIITIVSAVACGFISTQLAEYALKPLDDLTVASERVAEGDVDVRVLAPDVLEVKRLAKAQNKTIDRLREHMAYIDGLAYMDTLTGLPNRNAYESAVEVLNERIFAGEHVRFSIAMLDVNDLKRVNDTLGHDAGDELLKCAARLMSDTFAGHPVYRIGGDEFVVLLEGNVPDVCSLISSEVTIACGSAMYRPGEDTDVASVVARADEAMYEHKRELKAASRKNS